jgi:GxxExxY protein
MEIVYKEESYLIVGACYEVYNEKGCGFLEGVYQECLAIELGLQGIPFQEQKELALNYKTKANRSVRSINLISYASVRLS